MEGVELTHDKTTTLSTESKETQLKKCVKGKEALEKEVQELKFKVDTLNNVFGQVYTVVCVCVCLRVCMLL